MGNGARTLALGRGNLQVWHNLNPSTDSKHRLVLKNVLHVPELGIHLISVGQILANGYQVLFKDNKAFITNNNNIPIIVAHKVGKLFKLKMTVSTQIEQANLAKIKTIDYKILHARLGHLNKAAIKTLQKQHSLNIVNMNNDVCIGCIQGKQSRNKFSKRKRDITVDFPLQLVYSDYCGPLPPTFSKQTGFFSYIDAYSRKPFVYLTDSKAKQEQFFKEFKIYAEKQTGNTILALNSDGGGEYTSISFTQFLKDEGIEHKITTFDTPQNNPVAERFNRTAIEAVRSIIYQMNLPLFYWGELLKSVTFVVAFWPNKTLKNISPNDVWNCEKFDLSRLKILGCVVHVHVPKKKRKKLDKNSKKCVLVGYTNNNAYRTYCPPERKLIISRDVVFEENKPYYSKKNQSNLHLPFDDTDLPDLIDYSDEHSDDEDLIVRNIHHNSNNTSNLNNTQQTPSSNPVEEVSASDSSENLVPLREKYVRQSKMKATQQISKQLNSINDLRYTVQPTNTTENVNFTDYTVIPKSEFQAMKSDNWENWSKAMVKQIDKLEAFPTWYVDDIKNLPKNEKLINYTWVYKYKINPDTGVLEENARLAARGDQQRKGIDYDQTFSPVASHSTVRIFFTLVVSLKLIINQYDIKTAYPHAELPKPVYMRRVRNPKFPNENTKDTMCVLTRALYGLTDAGRCWNIDINEFITVDCNFTQCSNEPCLYYQLTVTNSGEKLYQYLLLYSDDVLHACSNQRQVNIFQKKICKKYKTTILGKPKSFLSLQFEWFDDGSMIIHMEAFIKKFLERHNMQNCKKVKIPFDPNTKLSKKMEPHPDNKKEIEEMNNFPYRTIVMTINYLVEAMRIDLAYHRGVVTKFQNNPGRPMKNAVIRALRYLQETSDLGILISPNTELIVRGIGDANFAGCEDTRKSTMGGIVYVGNVPVEYFSKLQSIVAMSTLEAEYIWKSFVALKMVSARNLMEELSFEQNASILEGDNQSAITFAENQIVNKRSKHIDMRYHKIRELISKNLIRLVYIQTDNNEADALTKPLGTIKFWKCITKMGMVPLEEYKQNH